MRYLHLPLFTHVLLGLILATGVAVGAGLVAWNILDRPDMHTGANKPSDIVKLALTVTAGIGAVVALIVSYRRQRNLEGAEERLDAAERRLDAAEMREDTKLFNERFRSAADQLGSKETAIRLAGVYAMVGLADDWSRGRQMCVDVLCAFIRMSYRLPNKKLPVDANEEHRQRHNEQLMQRDVREAIFKSIGERLRGVPDSETWHGLDFDFTNATIDKGNFDNAKFTGGTIVFAGVEFVGDEISFEGAEFSGGRVSFNESKHNGGSVSFKHAIFEGGIVTFMDAEFDGGHTSFDGAEISDGWLCFDNAAITRGHISFDEAILSGGLVTFKQSNLNDGHLSFVRTEFAGTELVFGTTSFDSSRVILSNARFSAGAVSFFGSKFESKTISFQNSIFTGGTLSFANTEFTGTLDLSNSTFAGGTVSFQGAEFKQAKVVFLSSRFIEGCVSFSSTLLEHTSVHFHLASFLGSVISLKDSYLHGTSRLDFQGAAFKGRSIYGGNKGIVTFAGASLHDATLLFEATRFYGQTLNLNDPVHWGEPPRLGVLQDMCSFDKADVSEVDL